MTPHACGQGGLEDFFSLFLVGEVRMHSVNSSFLINCQHLTIENY